MDSLAALKAEIAKKRKATTSEPSQGSPKARPQKRWRTKADIDEEQRKAYFAREEEETKRKKSCKDTGIHMKGITTDKNDSHQPESDAVKPNNSKLNSSHSTGKGVIPASGADPQNEPPLSKEKVVARLRGLKEPVTLFGESSWDRFNRMRELELAREEVSEGQRNVFQKKMREMEAKDAEDDMYHYIGAKLPQFDEKNNKTIKKPSTELDEDKQVLTCKEDYVYFQLRKYMRLWASEIDEMSKEERRTNKGRSLVVTHEQTKDWLKPLYKLLRKRKLAKNILDALHNIFEAAAEREYVRANSLYLEQLAIGNAPWPMGATMVGIHARAAREKIGEDKIAHVMNDERTRKYIQAVKRLLTVAQRHYPTSFSKMIM